LAIVGDTDSPTGRALSITSTGATTLSANAFLINGAKNYVVSARARQVSGVSTTYLLVAFFDASSNLLQGGAYWEGWPGVGTFHYYGLVSQNPPSTWTKYSINFGPDEVAKIPPGAVYVQLGFLGNYTGSGAQRFTDVRLIEKTEVNATGSPGQIILPANSGRTWGQRLSNNGWTTAQQKVDAGYPIVVQPVPTSGKHVEQHDLGKVLAIGVVRVTPTLQSSVAGYVSTIRIRGSNGDTNTSWQAWLVGDAASISNFRYLEVEYSVTSDGKGFVVLDDLYVKVEISEVTEATTLTLVSTDTAGTAYTCTKPFLDVRTAQAMAPMNAPFQAMASVSNSVSGSVTNSAAANWITLAVRTSVGCIKCF
jgi:hypothetical protein